MKKIAILIMAVALISCESADDKIADANDYNSYLVEWGDSSPHSAKDGIDFWSRKLGNDSLGVGAIGPLASAYTAYFKETGKVEFLHDAERLIQIGVNNSAHNKDGYLMSLAANFISQHRFRDAKAALEQAKEIPHNKRNLDLALFDVEMELGNFKEAYGLLKKHENNANFSYLVRRSKWADYEGKLSDAIKYLESANELATASGNTSLKAWTLTNLADYYGHAGEIEKSYQYYLNALKLDPSSAYALKGIAWINYSHDSNFEEADRILTHLIQTRPQPDYYLLKAEIAEARGLFSESDQFLSEFLALASLPQYGRMYNTYIVEALLESSPELALSRAKMELEERKTPETYSLFAHSLSENGRVEEALEVMENQVIGQTFEPVPAYYAAQVLFASGDEKRGSALLAELKDATFELGPVTSAEISKLQKN